MSASAPVRAARLVLERDLVAPLLSPWLVPRDLLRLSTTSSACLKVVRSGLAALDLVEYSHDDGGNCRTQGTNQNIIRVLDISGCNITVAGMSALPEKLESLVLGDCTLFGNDGQVFRNVLSDEKLSAAVRRCPCLQKLDLSGASDITETALLAVADACPDLRSLDLAFLRKVTDNGSTHHKANRNHP